MRHLIAFESFGYTAYEISKWENEARNLYLAFKPFLEELMKRLNSSESTDSLGKYKMFSRLPNVEIKTGSRGVLNGVRRIITTILDDPEYKKYKMVNSPLFPGEGSEEFKSPEYPYKNWGSLEKDGYFLYLEVRGSKIILYSLLNKYPSDIPTQVHKKEESSIQCLFWDGLKMNSAEFVYTNSYEEPGREYDEPILYFYEYSNENGTYQMEVSFFGSLNTNVEFGEISNVEKIS